MNKRTLIIALSAGFAVLMGTGGALHVLQERADRNHALALQQLEQGMAMFRENRYEDALRTLESVPEGAIDDWHLPYYKGSSRVMLKDFAQAAQDYEEALALNPREPLVLFALGVTYFKLNRLGLSKSYFAAVLELDPENAEAKGLMDIMARLESEQTGEEDTEMVRSAKSAH